MIDWNRPLRVRQRDGTIHRVVHVVSSDYRDTPSSSPIALVRFQRTDGQWTTPMRRDAFTGASRETLGSTCIVENIPDDLIIARKFQADTLIGATGHWTLLYADATETPRYDAETLRQKILDGEMDHTRDVQATLAAIRYGRENPA